MTRVSIDRIAAGGDGVGRLPDGMTVFVPRSAPGDVLDVEVSERKARYARGSIVKIVEGGPGRTRPECPHYEQDRCGGCQLQHLGYAAQLDAKRRIVSDALKRLGGRDVGDPPIAPSPSEWRYRTKLTLAARGGERAGKVPILGLHVEGSPEHVFALDSCRIASAPLMQLWQQLRAHRERLPRDLDGVVLRTDRTGRLHLVVLGGSPWQPQPLASALAGASVTVWWAPASGAPRVVSGGRGREAFPALAFEQVNPPAAAVLREKAVRALGDLNGKSVWDLYGGVGDTARQVVAGGGRVFSVDADRTAIDWAKTQGGGVEYFAERVEDVLKRLPVPDAVVVNPPRTGLHARVVAALDRWGKDRPGSRLSYVSCDPATLARDIKGLPSFAIESLEASDHFPQTAHVECLAVLVSA